MELLASHTVIDVPELKDRIRVFRDREDAGRVLAEMLAPYRQDAMVVLAIPAGGAPVGAEIARRLSLPMDLAVVSKITLPWDTEAGYGAVAFDGTVFFNERMVRHFGLSASVMDEGVARTSAKVTGRVTSLRGDRPFPDLSARVAILVDDGLASGFTMRVAVQALKGVKAMRILVVTPTGHQDAVEAVAAQTDAVFCANLRGGPRFAVADAYQNWRDVEEEEVSRILKQLDRAGRSGSMLDAGC